METCFCDLSIVLIPVSLEEGRKWEEEWQILIATKLSRNCYPKSQVFLVYARDKKRRNLIFPKHIPICDLPEFEIDCT